VVSTLSVPGLGVDCCQCLPNHHGFWYPDASEACFPYPYAHHPPPAMMIYVLYRIIPYRYQYCVSRCSPVPILVPAAIRQTDYDLTFKKSCGETPLYGGKIGKYKGLLTNPTCHVYGIVTPVISLTVSVSVSSLSTRLTSGQDNDLVVARRARPTTSHGPPYIASRTGGMAQNWQE
jgi:hypothetical protein